MMTRSGSGSSRRDEMQAGFLWVVRDSLEWKILEGPVIQGSKRTRKGLALTAPDIGFVRRGSKDRRKEASPLRCLTVSAMAARLEEEDSTRVGKLKGLARNKGRVQSLDTEKFTRWDDLHESGRAGYSR
jgi:hypothetical protein